MHTKKLFSGLLLSGLLAAFVHPATAQGTATPATATANAGTIIAARVRGDVNVTDKATSLQKQLQNNDKISQGSIVTTAKEASVVLVFSNGATVNLGTESVLDIEQFTQDPFSGNVAMSEITEEPSKSQTKLNLTKGELVGKVAKLKKDQGSTFTVGTPVGAAGIRGTTFRIVYRPDGTGKAFFSMTTLEGSVDVTLNVSGAVNAPVTVGDNKEVSIDVDITVNPATGQITVTSSTGQTLVVIDAPVGSTQPIVDAAQQIVDAVAAVVLTTPSAPPAPTPPPPEPPPPPPPPPPPTPGPTSAPQQLTPGAGG